MLIALMAVGVMACKYTIGPNTWDLSPLIKSK